MAPELPTRRLALRPARGEDVACVHALWTAPSVRRFLFDDRTLGEGEVHAFLARSDESFRAAGFGLWLGFEAGDRAIATFAVLLAPAEAGAPPSLVYGVRPGGTGRGLATETAEAVLAHAFGALALPRVHADVDAPNAASVRVLEKLGMVRVGERGGAAGHPLFDFELDAAAFRAREEAR
jgi:[ribosomal protein S5]-alanine N-acetyltransferase